MQDLIRKRKPALLLTLGTTAGLLIGGGIAWWWTQHRPVVGLPLGSDVIPREAAVTVSLSTNKGEWQQLGRFGSPQAQDFINRSVSQWRDRLLSDSGLDYQRDIQPWVGQEVTVAFLPPPAPDKASAQPVQPYVPPAQAETGESAAIVLPISNLPQAQQFLEKTKATSGKEWIDRDYKGVRIREIHSSTDLTYAVAMLDTRFIILSKDSQTMNRVVDTYKGKAAVAQAPGYSQAFGQLEATAEHPIARFYLNVPTVRALSTSNVQQPIPPLALLLLQADQGMVGSITAESGGIRLQGVSWLPADSKYHHKVTNTAQRMPGLLPAGTALMASGGNFQNFWADYSQQPKDGQRTDLLSPTSIRQGINNVTGLDMDRDLLPWMGGEYALALISAPATAASSAPRSGAMFLAQASDRKAADQAFQQFDSTLKDRYHFQVAAGDIGGKPVVNLTSPFGALTVTRGWLDNDVAFVTVGNGVASTIVPAPEKALKDSSLFASATTSTLNPNNGNFYMEVERLVTPVTNLPLPILPAENRSFLSSIRAIGVTGAIHDARTSRFDLHVLLKRSNEASPAPSSPAVTPSAAPSSTPPGQ